MGSDVVCLNPYCRGQWSRTFQKRYERCESHEVLILIVVDNGLVQQNQPVAKYGLICLNPYCSGRWSRT